MRQVPSYNANAKVVLRYYYIFKIVPLLIAAGSIYLGYRLFILGVTGQASLSIDTHSVKGQLLNATPGLFFAVGGIAIVIATVCKGVQIDFAPRNTRN
jgi:glucose uptake protein GlcU